MVKVLAQALVFLLFVSSIFCQTLCAPEDLIECRNPGTADFCPFDFSSALIDLYFYTSGGSWYDNTGWDLLTDPNIDSCTLGLYGLECTGSCPNKIKLSYNNLSGDISSFTTITYLNVITEFSLDINFLQGDLTLLLSLDSPWGYSVDLNSNFFTSSLPSISPYITSLDVSQNFLSDIPEISHLNLLSHLDLSSNFIATTVSDNFVDLPSLVYLDLSGNQISGELPVGLLNTTQTIPYVNLAHNFFTSFPSGNVTTIFTTLLVNNNLLSGELPAYGIDVQTFDASYNSLGPLIPNAYTTIPNLNLSYNSFRSPFPLGFRTSPPNAATTHLEFNLFDCPLPDWCSEKGNGFCEPCNTCHNILPGTLQHNLTLCDPYKNHLVPNPPNPVRVATSTEFTYVTTLYGGSFTTFYNLVPGVYYTFSACEEITRDVDGFNSVFILRNPDGTIIGTNDQCSPCANGHSEITYLHPTDATYSSITLSAFIAIQSSKYFSCLEQTNDKRSMPLYQKITYSDAFPACNGDYTCSVSPVNIVLFPGNNYVALTPATVDNSSYYCGFDPVINQTYVDCSTRGINYVEFSFYDYSCVSKVDVTTPTPYYTCSSQYILPEFHPDCTPHGCKLNIYDFNIAINEFASCAGQPTKPEYPIYAYIGDSVNYQMLYIDPEHGVTEVNCPIEFYGLRVIDILDETEIDTNNQIFDISVDYTLPTFDYSFSPFLVLFDDYDPKTGNIIDVYAYLDYERETPRSGGITLHNIDFSGVQDGAYYLMVQAFKALESYNSIGSPIVYFYTSS